MKIAALKFKNIYLLLFALIVGNTAWAKEDVEKTKSYNYSQSFIDGGTINFSSHANLVNINTWDKNEVKVIATIRVEGENEKEIEAFLADIKFEPKRTENEINLSNSLTINQKPAFNFGSKISFFSDNSKKVELSNGDKIKLKSYKVKYEIFLPMKTRLNLKNSYGEVNVLGDLKGESVFDFNSSKFKAENLGRTKISIKYGKSQVKSVTDAKIYLFESKMELQKGRELEINSKYSKLTIDLAKKINLNSFEDKVKIGKTDELTSNMKYGDLLVNEARSIHFQAAYELEVEIGKSDELKSDNSKYSSYKIGKIENLLFSESFEDKMHVQAVERIRVKGKYSKVNVEKLGISCDVRGFETNVAISAVSPDFRNISMEGKYMNIDLKMPNVSYKYQSKLTYGKVVYNAGDFEVSENLKERETQELQMKRKGSEDASNPRRVSIIGYESNVKLN